MIKLRPYQAALLKRVAIPPVTRIVADEPHCLLVDGSKLGRVAKETIVFGITATPQRAGS